MVPRTLKASVLVLLLLQPGWRMLAGQCLPDEDLVEATACCKLERYIPKDIAKKCFERAKVEHSQDSANFMICVLHCTFEAMGVLTANGVVDVEKYMHYLAPLEGTLREVVTSAVIYCAKSTDDILRNIRNLNASCHVFPLMFQLCVTEYSINNCPTERFTSSPVCQLVKTRAPPC